jgi:2-polyprenyl-3-methyl-5-hydroxy-6-metoxy-1,4-benzoquinol methylase
MLNNKPYIEKLKNRTLTIDGKYISLEGFGGLSLGEGKHETMMWINDIKPSTVLDVGAGAGMYKLLIERLVLERAQPKTVDAIEVWEPYVKEFELDKLYNNVYTQDVRDWDNWDYDLVIFGDVLEHMTKEEATKVWEKVSKQARYAIISIPLGHNHQDAYNGNPFEEHVTDGWELQEILDSFKGIVKMKPMSIVGIFLAEF